MNDIVVALLYRRVSDEEKQKKAGMSLEAQTADLRRYVQSRGWMIGGEFEDAQPGTWDRRPGYQAMLVEARQLRKDGYNVVLVVKWLSRLGRDVAESLRCRDEMESLGIGVHSVAEGEVGRTANDRFRANMTAVVDQFEVERLGERVRDVIHTIRKGGWHHGGRCPWGYRWRRATVEELAQGAPKTGRVLEPDPVAAPLVAEAFRRVAEGASARAIAVWIAGLPDEVKQDERGKPRALAWHNVRAMLSAAVYVSRHEVRTDDGTRYIIGRNGKKRRAYAYTKDAEVVLAQPKNRWPALVDDATWAKVQANIADHQRLPKQASLEYLLTGFLRCPKCNARMVGSSRHKAQYRPRYMCTGYTNGKCSYSVVAEDVEFLTLDELYPILHNAASSWSGKLAKLALEQVVGPQDELRAKRVRKLEADIARLQQRIDSANDLMADRKMEFEDYKSTVGRAKEELRDAKKELEQLQGPARGKPEVEMVLAHAAEWRDTLKGGSIEAKRGVLKQLLDHVVPVRVGYGAFEVFPHLTPVGKVAVQLATPKGQAKVRGLTA